MAKTRRVKSKRLYGGNEEHGPDTAELMRSIQRMQNGNLDLQDLYIFSLPPLPATVRILDIDGTRVYSLPESLPPNLVELRASSTEVDSLPALPATLTRLEMRDTPIENLPELPKNLIHLDISSTVIENLPELPPILQTLDISNTDIKNLPESLPPNLRYLDVRGTPITRLPELPPNLATLNISNTAITLVPKLPENLRQLYASNSRITGLPELPPTLFALDVLGTTLPPKRPQETPQQYSARIKARNLISTRQTILKDGRIATPGSKLEQLMDSGVLERHIPEFLTGEREKKSTELPTPYPTLVQKYKKQVTGSYNGGRTKKNKYIK